MSEMIHKNIRNPKFLSEDDICRPVSAGAMTIQNCAVMRPLPCIVILVHGVNDVGEAYQDQDTGICAGLNTRLGRQDLHPHEWKTHEFMISDADDNVAKLTCSVQDHTCIGVANRSPVIPFYWGYKPVDHETWEQDQKQYRKNLLEKYNNADLPYDTYRENDAVKIRQHDNQNIDNLNNWLDLTSAKGGGTFANATTCIPDMFGPGASGRILEAVGLFKSRSDLENHGDWSHPIYENPHRIYQAYAARRLADLILDIRRNELTRDDTINIVAHSQGTIITMLANMWVQAEGAAPADCVVLNHSPYALENRWLENAMPGNQQTSQGRQKTLNNFCRLMSQNPLYQPGATSHDSAYLQQLHDIGCISLNKSPWNDPLYNRNNFGKVYNYFCPNDQVVSMSPIQGFGWRGIPDKIKAQSGDNLYQRVFCKDVVVGDKTAFHFEMPAPQPDDSADTGFSFTDVTVNAPVLPDPFVFQLMAQGKGYKAALSGNDPKIAKAAMKAERFPAECIDVPASAQFQYLDNGVALNEAQLEELRSQYPWDIVSGIYHELNGYFRQLVLLRRMTDKELDRAIKMDTTFSQHSSIVTNIEVAQKSTAFDLAIGQCQAFEYQEFWEGLLLKADWRREMNPDPNVKAYYRDGLLPFDDIKKFMNHPELPKGMPLGELGVMNDYGAREKPNVLGTGTTNVLQWEMPKPLLV
ncbi:DUF3274 domain-containing protein [Rahnella victoriana]|uniref:DUF3274 domain-containing protein n=1 Tax=Rahnella victoriana TaxID=1510570 RepID=A0ABS0DQZ9_9GAMM|nr:DUF3274 domain-containing protein [Rahnella victoriana]MBF7955843.1 DUF3274 domain-containing protein [Rahnella victoriana]